MTWNPLTWLPFSHAGRQTLMYLVLALCGPALTACIMKALAVVERFPGTTGAQRLTAYVELAKPLTWALLIIVTALACFVSIRAVRIGKDGFSAEARDEDNSVPVTVVNPPSAPVPVREGDDA